MAGAFAAFALALDQWQAAIGVAAGLVAGLAVTYGVLSLKGSRVLMRLRLLETKTGDAAKPRSEIAHVPSPLPPVPVPTIDPELKGVARATPLLDDARAVVRIKGVHEIEKLGMRAPDAAEDAVVLLATYVRAWSGDPATRGATMPDEVRVAVSVIGEITSRDERSRHKTWRVDLSGADLRGLMLARTSLPGAVFSGADLEESILEHVDLIGALFTRANLRGALLRDVELGDAAFYGADLSGATFDGVELRRASLRGARWNRQTTWPAGFSPEAAPEHFS